MKLLIQNSQTGTLVELEIDDNKRIKDVINLLESRGDISTRGGGSFKIVLMGQALPEYMTIEALKDEKGLKSNDLLVLIESKATIQPGGAPPPPPAFKAEEEGIFEQLMNLPSSSPKPAVVKEQASPAPMPPAKIELPIIAAPVEKKVESIDQSSPAALMKTHGSQIEIKMGSLLPISKLEQYLYDQLGDLFTKIRGAWAQLAEGSIQLKDFAMSGVYVLKQDFIDAFLNPKQVKKVEIPEPIKTPIVEQHPIIQQPPIVEKSVSQPVPVIDSPERDIFSDNPFAPNPKEIVPAHPIAPIVQQKTPEPVQPEEPEVSEEQKAEPEAFGGVVIPSIFLDSIEEFTAEKTIEIEPISTPIQKKTMPVPVENPAFKIEPTGAFLMIKPSIPKSSQGLEAFGSPAKKVESLAPKKEMRTTLDAVKKIGADLQKIEVEPMTYDALDETELKSVNVGEMLPGSDIDEIKQFIYNGQYEFAEKQLKQLKVFAESKNDEYKRLKAEDLLTNLSVYKMIPTLIDAGDKLLDENLHLADEKYKKAENFAKVIQDNYYLDLIKRLRGQVEQRKLYVVKKRETETVQDLTIINLLKDNIKRLSKEQSLMSLDELKKYCQITKPKEFIEEILVEMIEKKEIYAKYFGDSQKIMFDKEANKEFVMIAKK